MIINTKLKFSTILFLVIFGLLENGCASGQSSAVNQNEILPTDNKINVKKELIPPTLEISALPQVSINKLLKIHWKIINSNQEPIYIYSTLLDESNSAFVELETNKSQRLFEIRFTRLSKLILEPNYFPKSKFTKIGAGESLEGDYSSQLDSRQKGNVKTKENSEKNNSEKLKGKWSIRALIAYSNEVDSVEKAINNLKNGHPIDPVVEWQKISSSKTVEVIFK